MCVEFWGAREMFGFIIPACSAVLQEVRSRWPVP